MSIIIYVRHNDDISLYNQYNEIAEYVKKQGYTIQDKILDFEGTNFTQAINKVIVDNEVSALIIYNKDFVFETFEDFLFYYIYLRKLDKKLIEIH